MKAAIVIKDGSVADIAVKKVEVPKIGAAEVLVQAASVNPLDVKLISGQMLPVRSAAFSALELLSVRRAASDRRSPIRLPRKSLGLDLQGQGLTLFSSAGNSLRYGPAVLGRYQCNLATFTKESLCLPSA